MCLFFQGRTVQVLIKPTAAFGASVHVCNGGMIQQTSPALQSEFGSHLLAIIQSNYGNEVNDFEVQGLN